MDDLDPDPVHPSSGSKTNPGRVVIGPTQATSHLGVQGVNAKRNVGRQEVEGSAENLR
jgi:hypothetical protein